MVNLLAFAVSVPALFVAHVAATLYPARAVNPANNPDRVPSPPILQPNHEIEWQALEVQTVTW